jgi:hypothetical protein
VEGTQTMDKRKAVSMTTAYTDLRKHMPSVQVCQLLNDGFFLSVLRSGLFLGFILKLRNHNISLER